MRRKFEGIRGLLLERVELEPFNQDVELSVLFKHIKNVVTPAVLPE